MSAAEMAYHFFRRPMKSYVVCPLNRRVKTDIGQASFGFVRPARAGAAAGTVFLIPMNRPWVNSLVRESIATVGRV
jgi:hypothetical protein